MSEWACFKRKQHCHDLCFGCPEGHSGAQHLWLHPVSPGQLEGEQNWMDADVLSCYLCSPLLTIWACQPVALCSCCWPRLSKLALTWSLAGQYAAGVIYKAWHFAGLSLLCWASAVELVKSSSRMTPLLFFFLTMFPFLSETTKSCWPSYSGAYLFTEKGRAWLQLGCWLLGLIFKATFLFPSWFLRDCSISRYL